MLSAREQSPPGNFKKPPECFPIFTRGVGRRYGGEGGDVQKACVKAAGWCMGCGKEEKCVR